MVLIPEGVLKTITCKVFAENCMKMKKFVLKDPGEAKGAMPPTHPVKFSHKKMADKDCCLNFVFLGPSLPSRWIRY